VGLKGGVQKKKNLKIKKSAVKLKVELYDELYG